MYVMRVLCVDGKRRREDIGNEPLLNEGDVYEVECEVYGTTSTGRVVACYKLACIGFPYVYVKDRFIPCAGDECEMRKEKETLHQETIS